MRRFVLLLIAFSAVTAFLALAPRARAAWVWPVTGDVITPYRNGTDPYATGQHRGIDIAAPVGAPVVAAAGGEVRFAGTAGSSGLTIGIRTADGYDTSYLHLSSLAVRAGAQVSAGERIGAVGTTGVRSATAPHLHFGVRDAGTRHDYHDPLAFLPPPPARSRTRPTAPGTGHRATAGAAGSSACRPPTPATGRRSVGPCPLRERRRARDWPRDPRAAPHPPRHPAPVPRRAPHPGPGALPAPSGARPAPAPRAARSGTRGACEPHPVSSAPPAAHRPRHGHMRAPTSVGCPRVPACSWPPLSSVWRRMAAAPPAGPVPACGARCRSRTGAEPRRSGRGRRG